MSKSFKRLVIDSATKYLFIALFDNEKELISFYEEGNNDHSVKLMTEIEEMFKRQKMQPSDIDEVIIGVGPGSYTGLRIGVVVAKMFGWNNNIPVKTISSLALIASSYDGTELIIPEIDARRGNSFLGLYKNTRKGLELVKKEELTNLENYKELQTEAYQVVSFGKPNMQKIFHSDLLEDVKDVHGLNPNYLRITEAERNRS